MPTHRRTLLCAVPQPAADLRKGGGRRGRRSLRLALALGLVAGFQGVTAGPAAVATLPSALVARSVSAMQPTVGAVLEFTPELGKDPALFKAILDSSFSFAKPRQEPSEETPEEAPAPRVAEPAPPETEVEPQDIPVETFEDPDEIIPFRGRNVPRWLVHSILKAAYRTGVDPVYMMTLADVESSLSPDAKARTSSAEGLFQFIDSTWIETVYLHASDHGFDAAAEAIRVVNGELTVSDKDRDWIMNLRTDPYFSALMAGELVKDVQRALHAQGERELAEAELYLAHFLGARSAVRFLEVLDQDPNMKASKLFPKAARANAGLFMEGKGRRRRPVSVAELYNKIDSKIIRRMDRYGGIAPYLEEVARATERTLEEASAVVQ